MPENEVSVILVPLYLTKKSIDGLHASDPHSLPPLSLVQKLLIDEKPCYMFGRAKDVCDFPLPHQSCSRQHAALVYHKHLNRPFLIDLGSSECMVM